MNEAGIPGTSYNPDASNELKLVYMVPFEFEKKMSVMLSKLESFQNIVVALEMTSLEDAYLKIVKQEDGGFGKNDDQI